MVTASVAGVGGAADPAVAFAGVGSAPNGLEPVLAEGREVDRQVHSVCQAVR